MPMSRADFPVYRQVRPQPRYTAPRRTEPAEPHIEPPRHEMVAQPAPYALVLACVVCGFAAADLSKVAAHVVANQYQA